MNIQDLRLLPNHQSFVERFVNACEADDRIVAAFLGGSNAKGYADDYSDVDLCVITKDESFDEFFNERETFLRSLGDLVFLEDFGIPNIAFYVFVDDTEGELYFGSASRLSQIHSSAFLSLIDKNNILEGVVFPEREPASADQIEKLRSQIQWFWHELSHFITAMRRDQLWWAQGQLESLRAICVNLARLRQDILDPDVGEEPYFKVERAVPADDLSALKDTFRSMEKEEMLKAVLTIVRFYLEIAPSLAQQHGTRYSHDLERVMLDRLRKLQDAGLA